VTRRSKTGLHLPEGYRLWVPGDGDDVVPKPRVAPAAYHGPIGDFLHAVHGETEADPAAIGIYLITKLGTVIGRRSSIKIGEHIHHNNLYNLLVGSTGSCKGIAAELSDRFMQHMDVMFDARHMEGSFGSGQAVLETISDRTPKERENNVPPREKRKCIDEPEMATVFKLAHLKESVLGQMIRKGYDHRPITHTTKNSGRVRSTGHHLSFMGGISPDEMVECVHGVDISNGLLNRFGIYYVEMIDLLAYGGRIDWHGVVADIVSDIANALKRLDPPRRRADDDLSDLEEEAHEDDAQEHQNGEEDDAADDVAADDTVDEEFTVSQAPSVIHYNIGVDGRDDGSEASALWGKWYLTARRGIGPIPDLTRRSVVHVARQVNTLSVLDQADHISGAAMRAAMAWEQYSIDSVRYLFGDRVVGRAADLLAAVRDCGDQGLDGTEQQWLFGNHLTGDQVEELRKDLEGKNLITTTEEPTAGRSRKVSFAIWPE
jgi:hypothetical protein